MSPDQGDFMVGGWLIEPLAGKARRGDEVVHLEPKVMETLVALARRNGQVLSRKELTEAVWPDTFVEDHAVTRAISELRRALAWHKDDCLETIPKHGYRLTAPVVPAPGRSVPAPGESLPVSAPPARPRRWRQRLRLGGMVALACLAVAILIRLVLSGTIGAPQRVMLAVLPFENLTGIPEQDFVSDGLTEELITRLGALDAKRLGVIARTSSFAYRNSKKRSDQIARELTVDYLVEGSIREDGDRVRITVQLITTKDQTHVWAQGYDDDRGHVLRLHDQVADAVTREIIARVAPGASLQAGRPAPNAEAREVYLKGRYALARGSGPAALSAREFFDQAIAQEPGYAQAWAGLATAYIMIANYNVQPSAEVRPKARAAALKAVELEPSLVDARLALAALKFEGEWDFAGAEQEFRQAVASNPNSAQAHQWYSALLESLGRFDEAIDQVQEAHTLDPVSLRVGVDLGRAYYFARQYDRSITECRKVIAVEPKYSGAHTMLGLALLEQHHYNEGITEIEEGAALLGTADRYSSLLGYAYAIAGRRSDAERILRIQTDKWTREHIGAWGLALSYVGLGNRDEAFTWLTRSREGREASVTMVKAFPYWDAIRADPRFRTLLREVGLPID